MDKIRLSPIWHHADGVALDYQRDLVRLSKKITSDVQEVLFPWIDRNYYPIKADERDDGMAESLAEIITIIALMLNPSLSAVITRLPEYYAMTDRWNVRQYNKVKKKWFNTDVIVQAKSSFSGVNVFIDEPWLKPLSDAWVAQNVDLIKSIPSQYHERVKGMVLRASMDGVGANDLKDQISSTFKIPKNRAELIAVDQIGKLNSAIEVHRMAAIGATVYKWNDQRDDRVRPVHSKRHGNYYNSIKSSGHNPGQEPRCRCYKMWVHPDDLDKVSDVRVLRSVKDY